LGGADQSTLLTLYRTLIRSKLDYGAIVYGSARKSYLKIVEPVANQALRICLGAYRTSPVSSLQVFAHELPVELRREQLSLPYCTKLKSNTLNPTHKTVFQPWASLYRNKPNAIPSLGLCIQTNIPAINIIKLNIAPCLARSANLPEGLYILPMLFLYFLYFYFLIFFNGRLSSQRS